MSDTTEYLFANNEVSIFDDAEPYHYGTPLTLENYFNNFDPDSITDASNDEKLQDPKYTYSWNTITSDTFYINNQPLSYVKKGTFPIIGDNGAKNRACWEETSFPQVIYSLTKVNLTVTYGEDKIEAIKVSPEYGATKPDTDKLPPVNPFNKYLDEIKRLGFVLVGGGGGAGGHKGYDGGSSGSGGNDKKVSCPGGGGGGGETVWGILNLEAPKPKKNYDTNGDVTGWKILDKDLPDSKNYKDVKITTIQWEAAIGAGGGYGTAATNGNATDGTEGEYSKLSLTIKYKGIKQDDTDDNEKSVTKADIIKAAGGKGGEGADINASPLSGGVGGNSDHSATAPISFEKNWCCCCSSAPGTAGGSITINSDNNYKASTADDVEGRTFYITYLDLDVSTSNTTVENATKAGVVKKITNDTLTPEFGTSLEDSMKTDNSIPGGHSYGNGKKAVQSGHEVGGGAAANCVSDTSYSKGSRGTFALYY